MHTSIYNWPLQPFGQDYSLASLAVLYVSDGTYSLMSTSNDRLLREFFMAGLCTLRIFVRNLVRGSCRRTIFHKVS